MMRTEENNSAGREICHSVTVCTIGLTWTDTGSKPGHRGARLATNGLP